MTVRAYYNEHNAHAAGWLRNLAAAGLIPAGDVDERDIDLGKIRAYGNAINPFAAAEVIRSYLDLEAVNG